MATPNQSGSTPVDLATSGRRRYERARLKRHGNVVRRPALEERAAPSESERADDVLGKPAPYSSGERQRHR